MLRLDMAIIAIIAVSIVAFLFWGFLGIAGAVGVGLAVIGLVTLVMKTPIGKDMKWSAGLFVLGIIVLAMTGGLAAIGIDFSGLSTASIGTITGTAPVVADQSECFTLTPEGVRGDAATITVVPYDAEAQSSTETAIPVYIQKDGIWIIKNAVVNSTEQISNRFQAGQVIQKIVGGNATFYVDSKENICVDGAAPSILLDSRKTAAESSMQITCRDDGGDLLTTGTNSSQEDYELSLAVGEDKDFSCKLYNGDSYSAYQLCAIATRGTNAIDDLEVVGSDSMDGTYTAAVVPDFLKGTIISYDDDLLYNYTGGYGDVWKRNSVLTLHDYDYVTTYFHVYASSSSEPAADDDNVPTDSDMSFITYLDCAWEEDANGNPQFDFYTHDSSENNAGVAETVNSPLGKQLGVAIEHT